MRYFDVAWEFSVEILGIRPHLAYHKLVLEPIITKSHKKEEQR